MKTQEAAKSCPNCGLPLQPGVMRCPRCNQLLVNSDGCQSCQGCPLAGLCHLARAGKRNK